MIPVSSLLHRRGTGRGPEAEHRLFISITFGSLNNAVTALYYLTVFVPLNARDLGLLKCWAGGETCQCLRYEEIPNKRTESLTKNTKH
jgi:hypothetical protein